VAITTTVSDTTTTNKYPFACAREDSPIGLKFHFNLAVIPQGTDQLRSHTRARVRVCVHNVMVEVEEDVALLCLARVRDNRVDVD